MSKLVLLRHGQSTWNHENRFTGWTDVDLSTQGVEEAKRAGQVLRDAGLRFDHAHTSWLKRAIRTLWFVLEELDQCYLPVNKDWRLNERHYGALQGLNKKETVDKHGADQVQIWRRSYAIRPPALDASDDRAPGHDPRYRGLDHMPLTESLADTVSRVVPYWQSQIVPQLKKNEVVLVAAHGNSLRALIKHLDGVSDDDIVELNIPTGMPLLYELDANLHPLKKQYLGDAEEAQRKAQAVAKETG